MKPTIEHAKKFISLLDYGLVKGLGNQKEGEMCIEACWCAALGLGHSDSPGKDCVYEPLRRFKTRLNDAEWSSNQARAKGMRAIGVAQAGSNQMDTKIFLEELCINTTKILLSDLLKKLGKVGSAARCRSVTNLVEAKNAAYAAADAADATANAAAYAAANAANAYAAAANAYAAADTAAYAADTAAYAAANAAAYAAAYAADNPDYYLLLSASICLEALKKAKSLGCNWLYLIDEHDKNKLSPMTDEFKNMVKDNKVLCEELGI